MSGLLLITADAALARDTLRHTGRGSWQAAAHVALEKHGYLDLHVGGPACLADGPRWDVADVVLIGRLPDELWTDEVVARALGGRAPVIVEGPLSPALEHQLGITSQRIEPVGDLVVVDGHLRAAATQRGAGFIGGQINAGKLRASEHDREHDWDRFEVGIPPNVAAAWHQPGWDADRWAVPDEAEVLCMWAAGAGDQSPAIIRRGSLMACSFGLLTFLGQSHTIAPDDDGLSRVWPRSLGTEAVLLELVDGLIAARGLVRGRVMPWPAGVSWVLSIRHDVDRMLDERTARAVLRRHDTAGTAATWYWRASQLATSGRKRARAHSRRAARVIAAHPRHEIAHHTEHVWLDGSAERQVIEDAISGPVLGTSVHGLESMFRWQGAPNVLFAELHAYAYTELLSHAHLHPHRFAALAADGDIQVSEVLCLPHHESFDRGTSPGEYYRDEIVPTIALHRAGGGCLQVLNHPDIHQEDFFQFLATLPREGRLDWTASQVVRWWRATHVRGGLGLAREGGDLLIAGDEAVADVVIERRLPDGTVSYHRVDVVPGAVARIAHDAVGVPDALALRPQASRAPSLDQTARVRSRLPVPPTVRRPAASVVVVHGGDEEGRRLYAKETRVQWSREIGVVLEKHGYLDVAVDGPHLLESRALWMAPGVVVISGLAPDAWTERLVDAVFTSRAQVFLDGPLPDNVLAAIGVTGVPEDCQPTIRIVDEVLRDQALTFGAPGGGPLLEPSISKVEIEPELHWAALGLELHPRRVAAWRERAWGCQRWSLQDPDVEVLAEAHRAGAASWPALVRRGHVVATSVGLLNFLVQAHTSAPLHPGEWRGTGRTIGLETLLLAILDDLLARSAKTRARILPWPQHARWALNVRHDVDRPQSLEEVEAVLARHSAIDTRASWYWRARHLRDASHGDARGIVHTVARARGHEVALHTDSLWSLEAERDRADLELAAGTPMRGSSAHGDRDCFRYQGAPNQLWAARSGLQYTEMLDHNHIHPHRFVTLGGDGLPTKLDLICLPHHVSFDRATTAGAHRRETLPQHLDLFRPAGGLLQVLNHPDLHLADLFAMLADFDGDDRLDVTAADAVDWWRRTHDRREIELRPAVDGGFTFSSARDVQGVVVELRAPDGSRRRVAVTAPAGEDVKL